MPTKNFKYGKGTEWTIMVYCASDNDLSPLIVSQLKALKEAGRHRDVNVVVYFDPNEAGVPTRLYCINQAAVYLERSALDSYVQNMQDDYLELEGDEGTAARELKTALEQLDQTTAKDALSLFLRYCRESYPANHYALVLLGHGMIVANDAFLPDEAPLSGITLKALGDTLDGFTGKLELLALHSCSMSAIEVAYELKGKANYMMASEGLSFVGGWPYRQLLLRTFSYLNKSGDQNGEAKQKYSNIDVRDLVERLYKLSSHNGKDFMLSGYSQDLALINLDPKKFKGLTTAMTTLVSELNAGLQAKSNVPKQFIQLAHLESQSYFNESYTDLYDFCECLEKLCRDAGTLEQLRVACTNVMDELKPEDSEKEIDDRFNKLVIHSRHFGSLYQFSHGLSIYFPWSKPLGTTKDSVLERYKEYEFTKALKQNSWLSFLNLYLEKTERPARDGGIDSGSSLTREFGFGGLSTLEPPHKTSGASGPSCTCTSIKNFAHVERTVKGKSRRMPKLAMSEELIQDPDND